MIRCLAGPLADCRPHHKHHAATLPVAIILTVVVAFTCTTALDAASDERPNIVLVMADDQGWGDTGYNGHPLIKTPVLDEMAGSGLRFDHFYAAAPVCSPTRGSVLTGRTPNRFGCYSWGRPLRPQEITLAERLQSAGYVTGHFGKWHLGSVLEGSPVNPGQSGFDHWLSAFNFYDNDPVLSREGKAVELKGESSMVAADAAIDFIQNQVQADKPFLAVVWFGSPHSPHRAAPEDRALYAGEKRADWMGEITGLDRAVGKLRDALTGAGVRENTLFWYTSDNGGLVPESSGGRAKKSSIYEGGLRVPAIIEWPAVIQSPRVTEIPATTCDIYPTVMDLLGIDTDQQPVLDGISLEPIIRGQRQQRNKPIGFWKTDQSGISTPHDQWMRQELQAQQQGQDYFDRSRLVSDAGQIKPAFAAGHFPGHAAWLDWPWKLHRIETKKGESPVSFELYNLGTDPMETEDLASQQPERVAAMRPQLREWLQSVVDSSNGQDYR
ncbi:sulfatase-like hydrolase/transferase [Roseiconus nitratireducens]|uniref:Sulfatase-like hydrolase/transferase n=1 Tax=Roseiconus nitratireducens TaxID=2605748 RepID=A0A5M6D1R7_9BACT|nr:sulfatase-like hydrolase/transferase [Roseiconus nitratireducens]KAA5541398.1 sulfatase-like hydrolase/transferase [Roseiconus nitratireducens]